ncbi:bifunctional hydroxymethylpyrimidine kinase/phosphomethylpyrimidine kinase [Brevibacterium luteolum]|uniref:bifunctional hydroxymethylpyrimidine kinase/phosphomethylpyrimidine kinase n=1 Tax=Brevibacterium luteolum TaxID=199591 RepID=UPI0021AFC261|nr:bifunctional hydroxymethylpyrimidine kinase/phosphomethylpyrimidine kinase [Brevibacterium luteolum]MCT1829408.1 bifunctional hydroxymethylpyrimidine kinase/phosphomethylpyrimidine kinase [Brevibacterium luteolum]
MTAPASRPPVALSIAGTDPSGGAGIHADLKAFCARGVYGTTAITALVAQNTHGVSEVYGIDEAFVEAQLASVLDDVPVDATKTGMLATRSLVELVCHTADEKDLGYFVVDPVMVATSGHRLLDDDAVDSVRRQLMPRADLITPNLPEAALLLGESEPEAASIEQMRDQAGRLIEHGARGVLLKGGHGVDDEVIDVLALADGTTAEFTHTRIRTPNTHGTGCTLSATITAEMAAARHAQASVASGTDTTASGADATVSGADATASETTTASETITAAVERSLDYLARALASADHWQLSLNPDGAHGPVDHLVDLTVTR